MNRYGSRGLIALAAVVFMPLLSACEDNKRLVVDDGNGEPVVACAGQESPEAVLAGLIDAYLERDSERYAPLLHPDFRFYFQDGDEPPDLGRDYWTRSEDSTGTAHLLNSPVVTDIRLDLPHLPAEPATEVGLENTMKIRIHPTRVDVDDVGGTTYRVYGDIQDMFFVRGDAPDTCWYLLEWRDIWGGGGPGSQGGSGGEGGQGEGGQGQGEGTQQGAVQRPTWGALKTLF